MDDYNDLLLKYDELKQEYDEFRKSSQEYERELELQADQLEKKVNSLQVVRQRLENDVDSFRTRHSESQDSSRRQIGNLQEELSAARNEISDKTDYIRRLELTNDDLERAKRALETNCDDLECQLEAALEQNAFLQSELDERESVCLLIQHLREELRDVQREDDILRARLSSSRTRCSASTSESTVANPSANEVTQNGCENEQSDNTVPNETPTVTNSSSGKDGAIAISKSSTAAHRTSSEDSDILSRTALSWSERRSILDGIDSDVHRVALSVVGAHAVAAAFQPGVTQADGSRPLSLPSAVASAQSALNLGGTLSPSVRIEALAIVNELVHRVGVLEAAVRKQLDGGAASQPSRVGPGTGNGNGPSAGSLNGITNPHKRFCLNLNGLHNVQPAPLSAGWWSPPPGASRTRFDFTSPYTTLRNRERANSASPCASNGVALAGASVLMSPFTTPSPNRAMAESTPPR